MASSRSRHVIVVGAGPAGAVLANLLATRGVRTTLLERQSDFAREFRGEVVLPSGIEALRTLDIDPALEKVPQIQPESFELYVNGKRVLRVDTALQDFEGLRPRVYSQPALLETVVAETAARTDLVFERGASVKELLHEGSRIAGVRVRTPSGERRLTADLVIGCDGRASVVRRQAPLEVSSEELPMDIVWFKIPAPANWQGKASARFCLGRGHLFICYVTWDGMLQTAWVIEKGSFGALRERGVDEWAEEMALHVPEDLSNHVLLHKDQLVHPFLLSTAADRVRRWSVPGALVLGDAAHTMSPVGGQGINIALRDAVVAANHLVPVLRDGGGLEALDEASKRIEAERMPEVKRIQTMQALPPRIMLPRTRGAELARKIPNLLRFRFAQWFAARGVRPVLNGVTKVKLRV